MAYLQVEIPDRLHLALKREAKAKGMFLAGYIEQALKARVLLDPVLKGFEYDPGHSDLDDEQPINVRMTLGDYRRARR